MQIKSQQLILGDRWTKFENKGTIFSEFGNSSLSKKTKMYVKSGVSTDGIAITNDEKWNPLAEYTTIVTGDVNGNDKIDSADLLRMRKHLLGISPINWEKEKMIWKKSNIY